jgi:hypothetical protein
MPPDGQVEGRPPLTGRHPDRPGQVDPPMFARHRQAGRPPHRVIKWCLIRCQWSPSRHDRLRIARLDRLSAARPTWLGGQASATEPTWTSSPNGSDPSTTALGRQGAVLCRILRRVPHGGVPGRPGDQRGDPDLRRTGIGRARSWPAGHWPRIAETVFAERIGLEVELHQAGLPMAALNSIACPVQGVRQAFDLMATDGADDWAAIARRLARVGPALAGYRVSLACAGRSSSAEPGTEPGLPRRSATVCPRTRWTSSTS